MSYAFWKSSFALKEKHRKEKILFPRCCLVKVWLLKVWNCYNYLKTPEGLQEGKTELLMLRLIEDIDITGPIWDLLVIWHYIFALFFYFEWRFSLFAAKSLSTMDTVPYWVRQSEGKKDKDETLTFSCHGCGEGTERTPFLGFCLGKGTQRDRSKEGNWDPVWSNFYSVSH